MSGEGTPSPESFDIDGGLDVAIVAARWHADVQESLAASAVAECARHGITAAVHWVPGTFEIPVVVRRLAVSHDAVIALGTVIRGGTPHFEYVCESVTSALTRIPLDTGTPVGFGILTCDDLAQALDRAGLPDSTEDKGAEAAAAALATATLLRRLTI
ncbi:MAG: 6,7-dimethyl-8-ribityllumazine synthase [Actinomycetota bacterium]|nr:6,7-dimethyl-8-ribityllumazine synthase [Actinomycetota bacterium]